MTETTRAWLWIVWFWLAAIHVLYYTSGWCRQRRWLREATQRAEQDELEWRMRQPVPAGTSGPWRWTVTGWVPVLPQVPSATGSHFDRTCDHFVQRRYCSTALTLLALPSSDSHPAHLWSTVERGKVKDYRCWGHPAEGSMGGPPL